MFTAAWTVVWAWVVVEVIQWLLRVLPVLWALLMGWLFPAFDWDLRLEQIPPMEDIEVVEVEIEEPPGIAELERRWEGDEGELDEADLAEAAALYEEILEAERHRVERESVRELALHSGLLAIIGTSSLDSEISGIFGSEAGVYSISGLSYGEGLSVGSGGLGIRGSGLGGGGTAEGLGGLGTIEAGGSGWGTGGGRVAGLGEIRDRGSMTIGTPTVDGALTQAEVTRVVSRYGGSLRYCYERGLAKSDGKLAGEIRVDFTIGATGVVSRASLGSASLSDPSVQSCVLSRFRRMRFPPPLEGGTVEVRFPVAFSPEAPPP
jgi:TonB family protein